MNPWRPVDALAAWLGDKLTAQHQLRLGIVLVVLSLALYAYLPFSGEPPLIYLMSAFAITMTGITIVMAAEVLINQEDKREKGD